MILHFNCILILTSSVESAGMVMFLVIIPSTGPLGPPTSGTTTVCKIFHTVKVFSFYIAIRYHESRYYSKWGNMFLENACGCDDLKVSCTKKDPIVVVAVPYIHLLCIFWHVMSKSFPGIQYIGISYSLASWASIASINRILMQYRWKQVSQFLASSSLSPTVWNTEIYLCALWLCSLIQSKISGRWISYLETGQ